jgi:hypothetical protein
VHRPSCLERWRAPRKSVSASSVSEPVPFGWRDTLSKPVVPVRAPPADYRSPGREQGKPQTKAPTTPANKCFVSSNVLPRRNFIRPYADRGSRRRYCRTPADFLRSDVFCAACPDRIQGLFLKPIAGRTNITLDVGQKQNHCAAASPISGLLRPAFLRRQKQLHQLPLRTNARDGARCHKPLASAVAAVYA